MGGHVLYLRMVVNAGHVCVHLCMCSYAMYVCMCMHMRERERDY
jgi:hypothetical protein